MDIFEFALKMEADGEKYYRELAEKTRYEDLKAVLNGLADDEQRHYKVILAVKNKTLQNDIAANPSLATTPHVFAGNKELLSKDRSVLAKLKHEQIDVYRAALDREKESVKLYQKLKAGAASEPEQRICSQLIKEEEKHAEVLDNIIELLNHANDWVESAEFNLKEENY